jgi:hypothetical protein
MSETSARDLLPDESRPLVLRPEPEPGSTQPDQGRLTAWVTGRLMAGVRTATRHVPTAAWVCALIAFLNACAWSLIVPPFQGRDEVDHFAYVAQIAETGTLPENGQAEGKYSEQQSIVMQALNYYGVRFAPADPTISTPSQQETFERALHANASTQGSGTS